MAACHNADSTGYEALASTKMSATRGKAANHYNNASDEEITEQHSAVDKKIALGGAASSTNERSDGPSSRSWQGQLQAHREHVHGVRVARLKVNPRRKKCILRSMRPETRAQ